MKKLFLLPVLLLLLGSSLSAQCSPDPIFTFLGIPGVFPDPLIQGISTGAINTPYSQTLTVVVLADTTVDLSAITGIPGLPVAMVSVQSHNINNVTGLPAGLSYQCNVAGCSFPGGTSGCVVISGTPTQAGSFSVSVEQTVVVDVPANIPIVGGTAIPIPGLPIDYTLDISTISIEDDLDPEKFQITQNVPNPADVNTRIFFNAPTPSNVSLELFDVTGAKHFTSQMSADRGLNEMKIETFSLSPGVYFYTLNNGSQSLSQKLIVTH